MIGHKWNSGPPPSVGWWPASDCRSIGRIRWWDGEQWGCSIPDDFTALEAGNAALKPTFSQQNEIKWLPRPASWPARSKT